jgi:hypothetical protein
MTEAPVLHADRSEPAAPENRATRQRSVVHVLESPNDRSDGIFEDTMREATGYLPLAASSSSGKFTDQTASNAAEAI